MKLKRFKISRLKALSLLRERRTYKVTNQICISESIMILGGLFFGISEAYRNYLFKSEENNVSKSSPQEDYSFLYLCLSLVGLKNTDESGEVISKCLNSNVSFLEM